jgi:hypothetical protein
MCSSRSRLAVRSSAAASGPGCSGCDELEKPPALAGPRRLLVPRGRLEVHLGVEEPFAPVRKAHPGLLVDGLRQLAERLEGAGYPVTWDGELPGTTGSTRPTPSATAWSPCSRRPDRGARAQRVDRPAQDTGQPPARSRTRSYTESGTPASAFPAVAGRPRVRPRGRGLPGGFPRGADGHQLLDVDGVLQAREQQVLLVAHVPSKHVEGVPHPCLVRRVRRVQRQSPAMTSFTSWCSDSTRAVSSSPPGTSRRMAGKSTVSSANACWTQSVDLV